MSSNTSTQSPTITQVAALTFTYRRIVLVWGTGPVTMSLVPFVLSGALFILNLLTGGFGLLAIVMSSILTIGAYDLIRRLATSKESLEKSLAANEIRLPVFLFIMSCILARFVVGPFGTMLGLSLTWAPRMISLGTALRLALAMFLLGLAVVTRYIGPKSIMRCSAVPLVSNPLESSLLYWIKNPFSILLPSDTPGELLAASFQRNNKGRRFQRPALSAVCAQIVVAFIIGFIVAFTTVFEWFKLPLGESFTRSAVLAACILTTLSPLVVTLLDGVSTEIDPGTYLFPSSEWVLSRFYDTGKNVLPIIFLIPALSIAAAFAVSEEVPTHCWRLYSELLFYCTLMNLYLRVVDEAIRTKLFNPRVNMKELVDELQDDTTPVTRLEVMLQSLLFDGTLVKEAWKPTQKPGVVNLEGEELRRCEQLMKQLGNLMVTRSHVYVEAPLEEDILRIAVLESFGGAGVYSVSFPTESLLDRASQRHLDNISEWVDWKSTKGASLREPLVVPLVRGLCVFAGGVGEALMTCSAHHVPRHQRTLETWALAHGAVHCAEYAITATARFIVRSLTASGRPLADWKSTHLSMLVPTALHAAFLLRCGVLQFAEQQLHQGSPQVKTPAVGMIEVHDPELYTILRASEKAASDILVCLKSPHGLGRAGLPLNKATMAWAKDLLQTKP